MKRLLRRVLYAGSAVFCGAMLWGASSASASDDDEPLDIGQVQEAVLGNTTTQDANSSISNFQVNINAPIAVLSDGSNNGDVTQSNEADNTAIAVNDNATDQTVHQDQTAAAASGGAGDATVDQDQSATIGNHTDQQADAGVDNRQVNVNAPIAVLSDGSNNGDVTQSNEADNTAIAVNDNATDQTVHQDQTGAAAATGDDDVHKSCDPCGDDASGDSHATVNQDQAATIGNDTYQDAHATVDNQQHNTNDAPQGDHGDKRCGYCDSGGGVTTGDVTQSNDADNHAEAVNDNDTDQAVHQDQTAAAVAPGGDQKDDHCGRCGDKPSHGDGGDATVDQQQSAAVDNATGQEANAYVDNQQHNSNNVPQDGKGEKRCGYCGSGGGFTTGDVTQSNEADNTAIAVNDNDTEQKVHQGQTAAAVASGGDDGGRRCGQCGDKPKNDGGGDATVHQRQTTALGNGTDQQANAPVDNRQGNTNDAGRHEGGGKPEKGCGCEVRKADGGPDKGYRAGNDPCGRCDDDHGATTGDVTQSNRADNWAKATNHNETDQRVRQGQTAGVVSGLRQLMR